MFSKVLVTLNNQMCRKALPCGPLFSEGLTKFNIIPAVFYSLWIVQRPVFKYNFVFVFLAKLECHNSLYPMKDSLYNHSTIWDWSEDQKWKKKSMKLISFKKCNMCTTSSQCDCIYVFLWHWRKPIQVT